MLNNKTLDSVIWDELNKGKSGLKTSNHWSFEVVKDASGWLLLHMDCQGRLCPTQRSSTYGEVALDGNEILKEVFGKLEEGISEGDFVLFYPFPLSKEDIFDQMRVIEADTSLVGVRASGSGGVDTSCNGPVLNLNTENPLTKVIGVGRFFVKIIRRDQASWEERFNLWNYMSNTERVLRQQLKVEDYCGFGCGLRGILTGVRSHNSERYRLDKGSISGASLPYLGTSLPYVGGSSMMWLTLAMIEETMKKVEERLEMIAREPDGLKLWIQLLSEFRQYTEAKELRQKATPEDQRPKSELDLKLEEWDIKLRTSQWRAALWRMDQYPNEYGTESWLDPWPGAG